MNNRRSTEYNESTPMANNQYALDYEILNEGQKDQKQLEQSIERLSKIKASILFWRFSTLNWPLESGEIHPMSQIQIFVSILGLLHTVGP